jgi:hypothetical protein
MEDMLDITLRTLVGGWHVCVDVLESDVHGTDVHAQIFELCEEVVEVVGCESELRRLDVMRGEREVWAREGVCKGD